MTGSPQMRVVPARHGWQWLRQAFPILGRHVAVWMLLVFVYWTAVSLIYRIPYVGPTVFLLTTPAITLSFMHMARAVAAQQGLHTRMLVAGFRTNAPALFALGGAYLVGVLVAMSITSGLHGDFIASFINNKSRSIEALFVAAATFAALYTPVLLALWFAPGLAGWNHLGAGKSLFFSFYAAWRNWRALLVYGIALFALWAVALGILTIVLRVFVPSFGAGASGPDEFRKSVAMLSLLATPIVLAGFALQFISYYLSYRDVFGGEDGPAGNERLPSGIPNP